MESGESRCLLCTVYQRCQYKQLQLSGVFFDFSGWTISAFEKFDYRIYVYNKLLQKIKFLQGARIYATGTDLWETTKIKDGWDPEAARDATGLKRYPFTRNFTFGVNLTF